MDGILNYGTFLATSIFFVITPGSDTLFVLNKSIGQGRQAGLYSTLGINTGLLIHTLTAALGLSVLITNSTVAFSLLKYAGASYLIYLGLAKLIINAKPTVDSTKSDSQSNRKHFTSGLFTNLVNPQVALFVLAFFPQFIQPEQASNPFPFMLLGLTQAIICLTWFSFLSISSASLIRLFKSYPPINSYLNWASSAFFISMGLQIALTNR